MCRTFRNLTDEDERALERMVTEGMDFLSIRARLPEVRLHELRQLWCQYSRAIRTGRMTPIPEDFKDRIEWVQAQWTTTEWGQRWVGRFAKRRDTDLQQAASRILR